MPDRSTTRRSFFGLAAGAGLPVHDRRRAGRARRSARRDAEGRAPVAAQVAPARATDPADELTVPHARSRSRAAASASTGSRRARRAGTSRRPAATTGTTADRRPRHVPRVRLPADAAGLRGARGAAVDPRPDAATPRSATCSSCTSATPTKKLRQAVTMHPHGVKYTPEYDGAYLGDYTRAGGFVAPGEEFTYTWECDAGLRRRVAVPRPRPQPHAQHVPRRCSARSSSAERGAKAPDVEQVLFLHSAAAAGHRPASAASSAINGRALRRQHADDAGPGRPGRRDPRDRHGQQLPRLPHPRAPLEGRRRARSSTPRRVGPNETITARFIEDNPGRWLYHCHVFSHQDAGMAGWYLVEP